MLIKLIRAPLMGAAFVLFLPFIGFVLLAQAGWMKVRQVCGA